MTTTIDQIEALAARLRATAAKPHPMTPAADGIARLHCAAMIDEIAAQARHRAAFALNTPQQFTVDLWLQTSPNQADNRRGATLDGIDVIHSPDTAIEAIERLERAVVQLKALLDVEPAP